MSSKGILKKMSEELGSERRSILDFWMRHMLDEVNGGFYGSLNIEHLADNNAAKGIVLNSRILWTFSTTYQLDRDPEYLRMANRAYEYIANYFRDKIHDGVFWSVDKEGEILEGKKQTYGQAFCIYGLSEYYRATGKADALSFAKDIFYKIEEKCFDLKDSGYIEAFTRDWSDIEDNRLSEKDQNERKTMNTHLHVVEAYANLYQCWPDEFLRDRIERLLHDFREYIIDHETGHLHLFMDERWNPRSTLRSFGHDIEASWLLLECANIVRNDSEIENYKGIALRLAHAASRGLDSDGGLWYEYDPMNEHWVREKHSWPQAEAIVGFINAWQLSGDDEWLFKACNVWNFVLENLKDQKEGEWFWGITAEGKIMNKEKAGFWKCPYHSVRACIEACKRIDSIILQKQVL